MSHFYTKRKNYGAHMLESVTTFAQARKHGKCVPSITTVLGYMPNDFLRIWREKKLYELAAETRADGYQRYSYEEASAAAWGLRVCPVTGNVIGSAEFGTNGHAQLEIASRCYKELVGYLDHIEENWSPWVLRWVHWLLDKSAEVLHCEKMMFDDVRGIAGTVDFIGEINGEVFVADFKFRDSKMSAYEKDCMQLAWAADVVKAWMELPYTPRIYSVIFDSQTPNMTVKAWTDSAQQKALAKVDIVSRFVNEIEGLA